MGRGAAQWARAEGNNYQRNIQVGHGIGRGLAVAGVVGLATSWLIWLNGLGGKGRASALRLV